MKNPIFFWLLFFFTLINLADMITARYILVGESNPIFLLFGSLAPAYILKAVMIGLLFYVYKKNLYNSNFMYYTFIMILLFGSFAVSVGVFSNVYGILNPEKLEESASVPVSVKVSQYAAGISFLYLVPLLLSLLGFKFYEWSNKYIIIKK